MFQLYDYQREAVDFANTRKSVFIGIPCRGGKTAASLEMVRPFKKTLIICPASLYHIWYDEIKKVYSDDETICVYNKRKLINITERFTIISYEKSIQLFYFKILKQTDFDSVIVDEAHRLKNYKSKRTQKLIGWGKEPGYLHDQRFKKIILLSGTPLMQRPVELYAAARAFRPDLIEPHTLYADFAFYYCCGYVDPWWNIIATGHNHMRELAEKLKDFLFIVDKDRVYKNFPPIQQQIVRLDVGQEIIAEEQQYCRESLEKTTTPIVMSALAALSHKLSLEKIDLCVDYINDLIDNGDKVVLFAWHTDVIEELQSKLSGSLKITGETPAHKRPQLCQIFKENTQVNSLICQIKAVGEGFDLSCAQHVVFVEFSWNPGDMEQCYKRVYKRNGEGTIFVYYLVASNSLDDYKLTNILKKESVVNEFNSLIKDAHAIPQISGTLGNSTEARVA